MAIIPVLYMKPSIELCKSLTDSIVQLIDIFIGSELTLTGPQRSHALHSPCGSDGGIIGPFFLDTKLMLMKISIYSRQNFNFLV